jgi:hypothetical protein
VYDVIYTSTGGVPRKINTLCNRLLLAGYLGEKHKLVRADAEAVVGEIREEAGVDVPAVESAPALQEMPRGESVVRPFAVSAINARLDRLEKSMNQALDLLRTLVGNERRPTKSNRQARG